MKKLTSVTKRSYQAFVCTLLTSAAVSGALITGFTSCDSTGDSQGDFTTTSASGLGIVDPDFTDTVARFLEAGEQRNITLDISDLDIIYGDTNGALGVCTRTVNTRVITISTRLRNATADLLDEIILHELGHCALFRPHSDNPESIMHATNIIGQPWREEVLDELFTF